MIIQPNTPFSNRYHLVRRIGVGGYSEVWLANDTLAGNMQVALKIFAPDKGLDEQGITLFSKEYALVFNLNHPNLLLPKHFDVADGSPFQVLLMNEAMRLFPFNLPRFVNFKTMWCLSFTNSERSMILMALR